jgi:hypothetical protein
MRIQSYLLMLCLCFAGMATLTAQTQYIGPPGGDWFSPANWNNGLPSPGNDALVGGGVEVVVGNPLTVGFNLTNFGTITFNALVTNSGTIANSGTVSFGNSGSLVNKSSFQNFGSASFAGAASLTNEAGATLTNTSNLVIQSTLTNKGNVVNNGTIQVAGGTVKNEGSFDNNQTLTVKTLEAMAGSNFTNNFGSNLNVAGAGATALLNGSFTNYGNLNNDGNCSVGGNFANSSNLISTVALTIAAGAQLNNTSGTVDVKGSFSNHGTVTNGYQFINRGTANNYGQFNNNNLVDNKPGGVFNNQAGGNFGMGFGSKISNAGNFVNFDALNSFGAIENNALFHNNGNLLSFSGSQIRNKGVFRNYGQMSTNDQVVNDSTFVNFGTVAVNGGSLFTNNKTFINRSSGVFKVVQDFRNSLGASVNNQGKFVNQVRTSNAGSFANYALFDNIGDLTNEPSGVFTNHELLLQSSGNILNQGSLVNKKKVMSDECSTIHNTGNITNQSNFELKGILFQRGTLSGSALNTAGAYVHTAADSQAPAICQDKSFGANIDGEVKVYAQELVAFSNFDSCANIVYRAEGLARPVYTCEDIGTTIQAHVVIRTRLNDSLTCTAIVTPVDELEPQISNCPKDRVGYTPNPVIAMSWTAPTATDNCTAVTSTVSHAPGSAFPVGITGVTYTFTDGHGNENKCQFKVEVIKTPPVTADCTTDSAPPVFTTCPTDITVSTTQASAVVGWLAPTLSDDCYPVRMNMTHLPGESFPVGTTTVTYTARDKNNNVGTCTFNITVNQNNPCLSGDQLPPVFTGCPANIWQAANTVINGAVVLWAAPSAADNCSLASLISDKQSGDIFPTGTTPVTYTATDAAGNSATCAFHVTIGANPCPNDMVPPVITGCPANIALNTTSAGAVANWTPPSATDACGNISWQVNYQPGSFFPTGVTAVSYKASDARGNTASCNFTVSVQDACSADAVKPVISNCPNNITLPAVNGSAIANWTAPTATDNCVLVTFSSSFQPGSVFASGVTTVVYTAIDLKGNTSSCEFNVQVLVPPSCTSNSAPIEGATDLSTSSVTLSWQSSLNASTYDVYLGTSNPPTTLVASDVAGVTKNVTNLYGGTTYYWYVVPKNIAGAAAGCKSSATSFTTKTINCGGCPGNLLQNGCFENGLGAFSNSASVGITDDSHTGKWAAEVCTENAFLRQVVNVTPTLIYDFSGWAKRSNDNTCGTLYFQFKNASGTIVGGASKAIDLNDWKQHSFSMAAPATAATLTITLKKCGTAGCLRTDGWCLTATCSNVTDGGTIGSEQRICVGEEAAPLTSISPAIGGTSGTVEYVWQMATSAIANPNSWTTIAGATGESFSPGILYQTTWYRRAAKRSNCTENKFSNVVVVKVLRKAEITVTQVNPTCSNPKGSITFSFEDYMSRSYVEFSLDNGQTYLPKVPDTLGFKTVDNLAPGYYDLWVRWGNNECPTSLGTVNLDGAAVAPTAKCKNYAVALTGTNHPVQITAKSLDNGSVAACPPILEYAASKTIFDAVGTYPVTLTVTNSAGMSSSCEATVTVTAPTCNRITNGLVVLYDFKEGSGSKVKDVSGFGTPLDLTIQDPSKINWLGGGCGLSINQGTIIQSATGANKIASAIQQTNAVTIEAWVKPANVTQAGPARIATYSSGVNNRNFTLGQDGDDYIVRYRTTETDSNGKPHATAADDLSNNLQHVVYTRLPDGTEKIYINGAVQYSGTRAGALSPWTASYRFALGNETSMDRAWLGEMYLVAVYNKVLTAAQVTQNFNAGACCGNGACVEEAIGEMGHVTLSQANKEKWYTVTLQKSYNKPVVVMSLNTENDPAPANVRVRNAAGNKFEFQIMEWDYLDGVHAEERISYFVLEAGTHLLPGGKVIQAGHSNVNSTLSGINFGEAFGSKPIVVAQVASVNNTSAVVTRLSNINPASFQVRLQRETGKGSHPVETVSWIAMEPVAIPNCEVAATGNTINGSYKHIAFSTAFANQPVLVAAMQTINGPDPAGVRVKNLTTTGMQAKIEEEQAVDPETYHAAESVGYFAFAKGTLMGCYKVGDRSSSQSTLQFGAQLQRGRKVRLDWVTTIDNEASHYVIERSTDGEEFDTLLVVESPMDDRSNRVYTDYDLLPSDGTNYYRLTQYLYDGRIYYGGIERVDIVGSEEAFPVFPNPAVDKVFVDLSQVAGRQVVLRLLDARGLLMKEWEIEATTHPEELELPMHMAGQYFLWIMPEGRRPFTKKLALERN